MPGKAFVRFPTSQAKTAGINPIFLMMRHSPPLSVQQSRTPPLQNPLHTPIPLLRPPQHLPSLLRQGRLARLVCRLLKKDGLPRLALALTFARLLPLSLLKLVLERRGFRILLGQDRLGHVVPQLQRFVRELLVSWRENFRGDLQRRDVDDGDLFLGRMGVLETVSTRGAALGTVGNLLTKGFGPMVKTIFSFHGPPKRIRMSDSGTSAIRCLSSFSGS